MPSFRSVVSRRPGAGATARTLVACWLGAIAFPAGADGADPAAEGPPPRSADAARPQEPTAYESPIATYRKFQPQTIDDWPLANQTVGEIGGWRTYATEIYHDRQRRESGGGQ